MRALIVFLTLFYFACGVDISFKPGTNLTLDQKKHSMAIQKSLARFTDKEMIEKSIRYLAAKEQSIRNFLVATKDVTNQAVVCVSQVLKDVQTKILMHQITPTELEAKILQTCTSYENQLRPLISAARAIEGLASRQSDGFLATFPQTFQDIVNSGNALQSLIQSNPAIINTATEFGPKVKAHTSLIRALSESDRQAVVNNLPFLAPLLLSNGSQYATFNSFLNNIDAYASGESFDQNQLINELNSLYSYFVTVIEQAIDHVYHVIQDSTVSDSIVNDAELNAVIENAVPVGVQWGYALTSSINMLLAACIGGSFVFK
uniref:SXP/RAL-2 family protein Ani s 5-like cation-binding domain-containing protein n=1 Tax=Panagrellus redivivus TaxID=6233 RepID=A0A7E4WAM0_PANRE